MRMTSSVRILRTSVFAALLLATAAHAQSVVYRCVDKEGRVLYTDTNTGGCKVVDSIVSGAISSPAPTRAPAANSGATMRQGASRPAAASAPAAFPRVD